MENILVTGALGQIGTDLVSVLRSKYGVKQVLASDIRTGENDPNYEVLDIVNHQRFREIVMDHNITQIYHLAAILSANGEWNPTKTWNVNFNAFISLMDLCREAKIKKLFFPSTIAVHGPTTPKQNTPQFCSLFPETIYGISKIACELSANYYAKRYQLDVRSIRYPGIISWKILPQGGTTDYAVEIFHAALKGETYNCFLNKDTRLPMMYIDDAIRATVELMEAPKTQLKQHYGYNIAAVSFTPQEIYQTIKTHIPDFSIDYQPDFRQDIAAGWSESIDDQVARNDWGWQPHFDLEKLVTEMLNNLKA